MMKKLSSRIRSFLRRSEGVSALEYAILVGVIAIVVGVALNEFSDSIADAIDAIGGRIDGGENLLDNNAAN